MISSFSRQLVRRRTPPLSPSNPFSARWASSSSRRKQKQAHASKLRKDARGKRGKKAAGGDSGKPKLPSPGAAGKGSASANAGSMPPPPKVKTDLPKAPHMRLPPTEQSSGAFDWIVANPLVFFGIIIPTLGTGAILLFRPDMRPRVGGTGNVGTNAANVVPVAVYEQGRKGAVSKEEKSAGEDGSAMAKDTTKDIANDTTTKEEGNASFESASEDNAGSSGGTDAASAESEEGTTVADLIRAIGIRPHPSS